MNVLYVYSDNKEEWNCSEWRCVIPARAINKTETHTADLIFIDEYTKNTKEKFEKCEKADVIVIQRNAFIPTAIESINWMLEGKRIIVDIDDSYQHMASGLHAFKFWHLGIVNTEKGERQLNYRPLDQLVWSIKLIRYLSSPSEIILGDWEKYDIKTILVPNYIETEKYRTHMIEDLNGEIHLGWGGSSTHLISFRESGIVNALIRILKKHKNVKLYLTTPDKRVLREFDSVKNSVTYHDWTTHEKWPELLAKTDIGVIPLAGKYDERRSWIKPLECAVMGIPWLSSYNKSYESIPGGEFVKNTANWWEEAIDRAISEIKERKQKSLEIAQDMDRFDVYKQAETIIQTYQSTL